MKQQLMMLLLGTASVLCSCESMRNNRNRCDNAGRSNA